jgi:membrane fusion protein, copper/silver efflux system
LRFGATPRVLTLRLRPIGVVAALLLFASIADSQSIRDRIRGDRPKSTAVTDAQATDLTLTKTSVTIRPIQVWVQTAGAIDKSGRTITASLSPSEGALVKSGQRVRAFPPERRSTMYQARVAQVVPAQDGRVAVTVAMIAPPQPGSTWYVMEIVTDRGEFLSVPNEAIIEEGDRHVVYVEEQPGQFVPHDIQIGVQGELYTQVLKGVKDGDSVVTIGSFFIDAEHKLKGTEQISQTQTTP